MNGIGAIPWYKSPVMIGAVVTVLSTILGLTPKLAAALGLTSPGAIQTTVDAAFQMIALVAAIVVAIKRQGSTLQPLTLTQAGADAHPSNAAVDLATEMPVAKNAPPAPTAPPPFKPQSAHLDAAVAALQSKGKS
jgi:hypothetical protein